MPRDDRGPFFIEPDANRFKRPKSVLYDIRHYSRVYGFMTASLPFHSFLIPGQHVAHPEHPEWGMGQVQSATGRRVVVMFPHAGKVAIDAMVIQLTVVD